jgi:hypothetical protein
MPVRLTDWTSLWSERLRRALSRAGFLGSTGAFDFHRSITPDFDLADHLRGSIGGLRTGGQQRAGTERAALSASNPSLLPCFRTFGGRNESLNEAERVVTLVAG